jgi:hypothetical protein
MSGGVVPPQVASPVKPVASTDDGCPTCKKKKPKVCKPGDPPDDHSDGTVMKSYDPSTAPPTAEELNASIEKMWDEKMGPWELLNGLGAGADPGNADFNFGRNY